MSKYKFENFASIMDEEEKIYDDKFKRDEETARKNSLVILNSDDSLNGSHSLVETPAKKQWLTKLREEHHNPLLGKDYISRAPEYERDDEEVKKQEYVSDEKMGEIMDEKADPNGAMHIKEGYNPNVDEEDVIDHDEMTRRFVASCVIDNTTAKCIGWDIEDVLKECTDALMAEFGEDGFSLPDDFNDMVEASVEKAETEARLLKYEKSVGGDAGAEKI